MHQLIEPGTPREPSSPVNDAEDRVTPWRTCKSILSRLASSSQPFRLPVRFPAFRLIVKVVEQAAFRNEQSVALERPLCNKREREGKKNVSIRENKRSRGKKKNQVHVDTPIFIVEERERGRNRVARYRSIVVYSTP